jgi:hypothetical protein
VLLGIIVVWLLSRHVVASPETRKFEEAEVHV